MAHYNDGQVTFLLGDVRDVLREMPAESVNMCVTSPPYWGLRDYGTATWEGGDVECEHTKDRSVGITSSGLEGGKGTTNHQREASYRDTCGKCGARRIDQQLGLERTPEEYVTKMVDVFREVRRVLRPDGTLWLNIGDSYAASGPAGGEGKQHTNAGSIDVPIRKPLAGLKPKDLVGIPWMLAFALRADGWYLRQDIIWAKPNPMPESVRDRCTKAHEYVFLLSKSERYYFDAKAISEELKESSVKRNQSGWNGNEERGYVNGPQNHMSKYLGSEAAKQATHRNRRSVWTVSSQPFKGAHFATFPPKLIEPCILAGCPEGGTVLDPFAGSGTTALVARRLGRKAIGIDLNAEYLDMAVRRAGGQLAMEMTR